MDLNKLSSAAEAAIDQLNQYAERYGEEGFLKSIRCQMEFIFEHASSGVDPVSKLGDRTFTYAVMASRELASPEEMVIVDRLNQVTRILSER